MLPGFSSGPGAGPNGPPGAAHSRRRRTALKGQIRRLAALALAIVMALSLSGCGIYFADYDNGKTKIERDENGAHEIEIMKDYIRILENDYVIIGVSHITETYVSDTEKDFSFDFVMVPKTKDLVSVKDFEWKLYPLENFAGEESVYEGSEELLFEPTVADQSYHVSVEGIELSKGCDDMIWADRLEISFGLGCTLVGELHMENGVMIADYEETELEGVDGLEISFTRGGSIDTIDGDAIPEEYIRTETVAEQLGFRSPGIMGFFQDMVEFIRHRNMGTD